MWCRKIPQTSTNQFIASQIDTSMRTKRLQLSCAVVVSYTLCFTPLKTCDGKWHGNWIHANGWRHLWVPRIPQRDSCKSWTQCLKSVQARVSYVPVIPTGKMLHSCSVIWGFADGFNSVHFYYCWLNSFTDLQFTLVFCLSQPLQATSWVNLQKLWLSLSKAEGTSPLR